MIGMSRGHFRGRTAAAPLKHISSPSTCMVAAHFRGRTAAAPLKLAVFSKRPTMLQQISAAERPRPH